MAIPTTLVATQCGDDDCQVWALAHPCLLPSHLVGQIFQVQICPNKPFALEAFIFGMVGLNFTLKKGVKIVLVQCMPFARIIRKDFPLAHVAETEEAQFIFLKSRLFQGDTSNAHVSPPSRYA